MSGGRKKAAKEHVNYMLSRERRWEARGPERAKLGCYINWAEGVGGGWKASLTR